MDDPRLRERFRRRFDSEAQVVRAPGRVNLIGEHTDYNDGFVLPAAISAWTWIAFAPRSDRKLVIHSENLSETAVCNLDADVRASRHWSDYPFGVAAMLQRDGVRLGGTDMLVVSEVPLGAGLSSSASLEVATAVALLRVAAVPRTAMEIARVCQQAENEVVGARCGIMDQFASCAARCGHALFLDCRSLETEAIPLPPRTRLVVCNTMVRHAVAAGEYNRRRAECDEGVRQLAAARPHISALRDVTMAELVACAAMLPEPIRRRCRHVISENARVTDARAALAAGDIAAVGRLMAASHASLRDDYEVSCPELDRLVDLAAITPGVHGARMTGGGFGGCTVNLVDEDHVDSFRDGISEGYEAAIGHPPEVYAFNAVDGACASERVQGFEGSRIQGCS